MWIKLILASIVDGMIAATLSALAMCITWAWFEMGDKVEAETDG